MGKLIHPDSALFQEGKPLPVISPCEHVAGKLRFVQKSFELARELNLGFDITCDFEDGAPSGGEQEHLSEVLNLLAENHNYNGRLGVRLHSLNSSFWRHEVVALLKELGPRLDYISIPKVSAVEVTRQALVEIEAIAQKQGLPEAPPVHLFIETLEGLNNVWELAKLPNLECLNFGIMDFVSAHQAAIPASAMKSPGQFTHQLILRAKAEVAAAALSNSLIPCHNVTVDYQKPELVFEDAKRARNDFGYLRMWSIHPSQIKEIIKGMQPLPDEVKVAAEVLLLAQDNAWAPISYQGTLHDRASFRYYWYLLRQARNLGMQIPAATDERFFN